jgi:hypothetical protein
MPSRADDLSQRATLKTEGNTMTTTILHANVQRHRFAQHAGAVLTGLIPAAWRRVAQALGPVAAPTEGESAAREAQRVRALAYTYAKSDPGFAADLYAAAARHEALHAD